MTEILNEPLKNNRSYTNGIKLKYQHDNIDVNNI